MIELNGIRKYFPANNVLALEDASFTLKPGEIHALLGENGAGKSTLMHILAGFQKADSGKIIIDKKNCNFKSVPDALNAGIGMLRQHPHIVRGFKVRESCILGAEKKRKNIGEISKQWGLDLPLDAKTETLSAGQRQKAALLSLLLRDVRFLIFDEAAAVLGSAEKETLFSIIRRLKDAGKGIALISHKLDDTLKLADRITVIRHGKTAGSRETSALSGIELEKLIFGDSAQENRTKTQKRERKTKHTAPVFSVKNLSTSISGKAPVSNFNMEIHRNSIIGICGNQENGIETLELALSGSETVSGTIHINGKPVNDVKTFRNAGGAYLGSDRLGINLAPSLPLKESLIIHSHNRSLKGIPGRFGIMDKKMLDLSCGRIMEKAGVKRNVYNSADTFSGGMLQNILLMREIAEQPELIIISGGSWGLDKLNREKLAAELKLFTQTGKAALLFSSDPDELTEMADEVFILTDKGQGTELYEYR